MKRKKMNNKIIYKDFFYTCPYDIIKMIGFDKYCWYLGRFPNEM
jgi:hypothetical protein